MGGDGAGSSSTAPVPQALGHGARRGAGSRPLLTPLSCRQRAGAAGGPPGGFIGWAAGRDSSALCPQHRGVEFPVADGSTERGRARSRLPLSVFLPPRVGRGPNSRIGPSGVNLAQPLRLHLGSGTGGMLQWGTGWSRGRDARGQSGFAAAFRSAQAGAGKVSPPSASLQGRG